MSQTDASSLLRALIIEDEWPARNYLAELLQSSGLADVIGAAGDLATARDLLVSPQAGDPVDVVFVDVRLAGEPEQDAGLALIREFARSRQAPQFVIASAFPQHTLKAFELGVVDYLLKPFSEERVEQCLRRVLTRRPRDAAASRGPTRIVARRRKNLVFLAMDEVWAIEASNRLTFVHTPLGKFELDLSLNTIEATCGRWLTRVHRNWLVNLPHVRELRRNAGETTLYLGKDFGPSSPGIQAPVARERTQLVRDALLATASGIRRASH